MVVDVAATSATVVWVIPAIIYTAEYYSVQYGVIEDMLDQSSSSISSGSDITIVDQMYNITLQNLHPDYTYYYQVTAVNTLFSTSTEVFSFQTPEAGKSHRSTIHVLSNSYCILLLQLPADLHRTSPSP